MNITDDIKQIRDTLISTLPIEKLYLFGSYAYGTPTEDSDYDFYVLLSGNDIKPIDAKIKARRSLSSINRTRDTDILADYAERFEERKMFNTLERKVANDGVLIYEKV